MEDTDLFFEFKNISSKIIVFDDIDKIEGCILPCNLLCEFMERNLESGSFLIICTKSDSTFIRSDLFALQLEIGCPNLHDRELLLRSLFKKLLLTVEGNFYKDILDSSHGYSFLDLEATVHSAFCASTISGKSFEICLSEQFKTRPSVLRPVTINLPKTKFSDFVSVDQQLLDAKNALFQNVKGILVNGSAGSGKSSFCHAIINESKYNYIYLDSAACKSKFLGESERSLVNVFRSARRSWPCIIFIENLEVLAPSRDLNSECSQFQRLLSCFLTEMDGVFNSKVEKVIVLATTSDPTRIDNALLRAGRFEAKIQMPELLFNQRLELLKLLVSRYPLELSDRQMISIVEAANSAANLKNLIKEAGLAAIRRDVNSDLILFEDFHIDVSEQFQRLNLG